MTTENVAILFTDVVGSTELSQRLPAEVADQVRRDHFSILRQAIAEGGGTEVKNLGDGLMVVFSTPSAALAAAVSMQQGVERDNRSKEHFIGLRVGLGGGEVSRENDDYFGDPVVEAARLCATCESGQVLATEVVRAMAGRRSRHECRSLGELTLKGLPDPVETVEVVWEPLGESDAETAIPLPLRMAVAPTFGVVGRSVEVEVIETALKRIHADEGREVVLVSGEAGLGKTTLVGQVSRRAFDAGACVLFGHAEEDLAAPYQLFAEALGHYVLHIPEDWLRAHCEEHGSDLVSLLPALAKRIPDLPASRATDADTERYLLFAGVVAMFAKASQVQPIVLVLDDLQWADKGSLQLLRHLASTQQPMRLLVLATYRDTELSKTHPLLDALGALHRLDRVSFIDLKGLDDRGVLDLLEAAAGHTLDDDGVNLARAVYRETDGNPFFVSEVLRHLAETGAIYQSGSGRWVAQDGLDQMALPNSVRTVIGARVGRLGQRAERILGVASVIGRDFDVPLLARASGTSEDDLLDILEAATAAALVREPSDASGRYIFAHALIQHSLYEDLGSSRRALAHRQIAQALEDLCGERPGNRIGELARHWVLASQPVDVSKAIIYCRQAGDEALGALAPADAMRWFTQALDLYRQASNPDPVLLIDLTIGLGNAQRQTGDPAYRDTLIEAGRRAVDVDDTDRLVAAVLANDRGIASNVGVYNAEKVTLFELALERLPKDRPERAQVLAALCGELSFAGSLERRLELGREALAIAEASGDDATVVRVVHNLVGPLGMPSTLSEFWARTRDALERAQHLGDPSLLFWAAARRAIVAVRLGHIDEFDRCVAISSEIAENLEQPFLRWVMLNFASMRAQLKGNIEGAERFANEALQMGSEAGVEDAIVFYGPQIFAVHQQRGSLAELIPLLEQLEADAADVVGLATSALEAAYVDAGRIDDVRDLLDRIAAADFEVAVDSLWLNVMVNYAGGAIAVREPRYAEALLERMAPWANQWVTAGIVGSSGPVCCFLGGLASVLGRFNEGNALFVQSAAICSEMGAKYWAARTNLMWGTMLAERNAPGDAEKAHDVLTRAHTVAATNGYGSVERLSAEALELLNH